MDWPRLELWLGDRKQRAGDRAGAARSFMRSGPVIGRTKALTRSVEALLWPQAQRFRNRRRGRRVPPEVVGDVAAWLEVETTALGEPAVLPPATVPPPPTDGRAPARRPDPSNLRSR
jgi:hypothetical protein